MLVRSILIILFSLLLSACAQIPDNPPKTMSHVDLTRYMGTWYEIASFPAPFQSGCFCTQAQYQLKQDKVMVTNSCRKDSVNGSWKEAHATGKVVDKVSNSKLQITFFWPFKAYYWILYVSPNYQNALVGTPDRKYMWILSRKKTMSTGTFKKLTQIAKERGYDLSKLHTTTQCPMKVKN